MADDNATSGDTPGSEGEQTPSADIDVAAMAAEIAAKAATSEFVPVELPKVEDLAKIAAKCAAAAAATPSALAIDAMKGLAEPTTKKVAEAAVKKCCGGASKYLKETKPEIQEDLEKTAKKCCGGCSKSKKEEIKKKGGSCGGVRTSACSTSKAASPGFCPTESVMMYSKLMAAKEIAEQARTAALASLGTTPTILTTAPETPATPTIVELLAVIGELLTALQSLIMTQEVLLGKTYP